MTRRAATLLFTCAALATLGASPVLAYLKLGFDFDGQRLSLRWTNLPVQYFVSQVGAPGVTANNVQFAVDRAFETWADVDTSSITYERRGFTFALPGQDDGRSTLGFLSRPDLDRVLASTSFLVDGETGQLIEADVFFNTAFLWSTAAGGENGRYDLQSVALHEIGHLSGLGHSALGETEFAGGGSRRVVATEAVMFPIAAAPGSIVDRTLRADDIAGISDLYPAGNFAEVTGSISGRVTRNGSGVFGAHIAAFNLTNGEFIGNFSLNAEGRFSIAGLSPGAHLLRVEPLDDADTDGFFPADASVGLDFRVTYPQRIVVVPRGGDSGIVEIEVAPK